MEDQINSIGGTRYGEDIGFSRFNFSEERINHLRNQTESILSFLYKPISNDNFQAIFDICFDVIGFIPLASIMIDYKLVHFILRARANYNGEIFCQQEEISYNSRNIKDITANRFNRPQESMFYGTLPSDKQERFVAGVSLECCKDLINDKSQVKIQYLTFGKWIVKKSFPVLNLCFNNNALLAHPGLNNLINNQLSEMKAKIPAQSFNAISEFWQQFSDIVSERSISEQ